jgi:AcrR family transcriptional regulator
MTRDALLDAAQEVFVKRGVAGASMEEIATEAGFSRGAIYSHFGSKDELLLAVMDRFITQQVQQMSDLAGSLDPMTVAFDAAETLQKSYSAALVPFELELRMSALRHEGLRKRLVEIDRRRSRDTAQLIEKMVGGNDGMRIPAADLADIGRAAVIGLLSYAAVDEELRERYEGLVKTFFVFLTEALMPQSTPSP